MVNGHHHPLKNINLKMVITYCLSWFYNHGIQISVRAHNSIGFFRILFPVCSPKFCWHGIRQKKVEYHRLMIDGEEKRKALQNYASPIETTIHIYKNISMHMHVQKIFESRIKCNRIGFNHKLDDY